MKIIDCFMFYNEIDILAIRLQELYDVVDHFVIIEATVTHTNTPKPMYFTEHIDRFAPYMDKIIHRVTDFSEHYSFEKDIHVQNDCWFRENYQRECCKNVIDELHLEDDDIIMISDCDEIPNHSVVAAIRNGTITIHHRVYSLEMILYYYTIELTTSRRWYHARLVPYCVYKKFPLLTAIRFHQQYDVLPIAGYHLSYYGDVQFIKTKVESFAESGEYSKEGKEVAYLEDCYKKGILHFNKEVLVPIPLATNPNVPLFFKSK
jgi:beta-1,4-mannosyl-glycoprotein beta-1,4-N-acetylglucosaminyltransferase